MGNTFYEQWNEGHTAETVNVEDVHYNGKNATVHNPMFICAENASFKNYSVGIINHHYSSV